MPAAITVFVAKADEANDRGNVLYKLTENGDRVYLPNSVRCYLERASVITKSYEGKPYPDQQKLLLNFSTGEGTAYCLRVGVNATAAQGLLKAISVMSAMQLCSEVQLSFRAGTSCVFADVAVVDQGKIRRVMLPAEMLKGKLNDEQITSAMERLNNRDEALSAEAAAAEA